MGIWHLARNIQEECVVMKSCRLLVRWGDFVAGFWRYFLRGLTWRASQRGREGSVFSFGRGEIFWGRDPLTGESYRRRGRERYLQLVRERFWELLKENQRAKLAWERACWWRKRSRGRSCCGLSGKTTLSLVCFHLLMSCFILYWSMNMVLLFVVDIKGHKVVLIEHDYLHIMPCFGYLWYSCFFFSINGRILLWV